MNYVETTKDNRPPMVEYEIKKHIGNLNDHEAKNTKELNIILYKNYGKTMYDIRNWYRYPAESTQPPLMKKGITLTEDEAIRLYSLLKAHFEGQIKAKALNELSKQQNVFLD